MINWAVINPGLELIINELAFPPQNPVFKAMWSGRARMNTHSGVQTDIILKVSNVDEIGEDETRQTSVVLPGEITTPQIVNLQTGNRRITYNIRVEAFNNTDATWSWQTIERIRTRLRRPSTIEQLNLLNLAIIDIGPSVDVPVSRDSRDWSVASLDMILGYRFCDVEDTPMEYISSVELDSDFINIDEVELPDPPNYEESVITE